MAVRNSCVVLALAMQLFGALPGMAASEASYDLKLSQDGRSIHLKGRIDFGITRDLDALLAAATQVRSLRLESVGGRVAEARGLVTVIRRAGIDTVASGDCISVCTLVLMSGATRYLEEDARLGFHAYAVRPSPGSAFIDARAEQEKDMNLFRARGVSEDFIARVIATPHDSVWYPARTEILDAQVVDALGARPSDQKTDSQAP